MLAWSHHDHMIGVLTAVGLRGVYSVQQDEAGVWFLRGVGHDGISMLVAPKSFADRDSAQEYAAGLDTVKVVESQASGC